MKVSSGRGPPPEFQFASLRLASHCLSPVPCRVGVAMTADNPKTIKARTCRNHILEDIRTCATCVEERKGWKGTEYVCGLTYCHANTEPRIQCFPHECVGWLCKLRIRQGKWLAILSELCIATLLHLHTEGLSTSADMTLARLEQR